MTQRAHELSKHVLERPPVWFSPATLGRYICFNVKAESEKENRAAPFISRTKSKTKLRPIKHVNIGAYNSRPDDKVASRVSPPRGSPQLGQGDPLQGEVQADRWCSHQSAPRKHQGRPVRPRPLKCVRTHNPACKGLMEGCPATRLLELHATRARLV